MRAVDYVTPATLDAAAERWLNDLRSATRPPRGWPNPSRCALLVVDVVRYFAEPGGRCFLPASAAVLPRILSLVACWRSLGAPVVFTRHGHDGPDDTGGMGRFYSDFIREGEAESALVPTLVPGAGEPVFRKRTYDAFVGTGLEGWLRERQVTQLLVSGLLTHLCCETTARSAFVRDFDLFVVADAMASTTERLHLGSLLSLADGFATVVSTREVTEKCAASR